MIRLLTALIAALMLAACAAPRPVPDSHCQSGGILIDSHFDAGQMGLCTVAADGTFILRLFPEDAPPINRSPWYSFRVSGRSGENVLIRMEFEDGFARYWPKVSQDGEHWARMPEEQVMRLDDGNTMEVQLQLDGARAWISAQEILDAEYYRQWINELAATEGVSTRLVGTSVEGRPLYLAETADRPDVVLMIGRQHPPEVTGALAMRRFVQTVLADTELAQSFRDRFKLIIVPLVNPDGVAAGHWRHNLQGKDLNRDWGPFTQPETISIRRHMDEVEASGKKLRLMLDFHSTSKDLFYTQLAEKELDPPGFTTLWLTSSAERMPDFEFEHSASRTSEQANSKNYWFSTNGIAAITYEVGDETPRDSFIDAAEIFAEEMMRTMLETTAGESD